MADTKKNIKFEGVCLLCGAVVKERDFLDDIEYKRFINGEGCGVCQACGDCWEEIQNDKN